MAKNKYKTSQIDIYDTSMIPEQKTEDFLKENHIVFLDLALEPYEKYIKFTEDYLNNEAEKYELRHIDCLKTKSLDWKESEHYAQRLLEIDNEFAQRFRKSIIVQLYSFFERSLVSSCELFYSNKDLNDNDREKIPNKASFYHAKKFIKNNAGIELEDIDYELDFFTELNTLRNRIVHHETSFFSDEERNIKAIRTLSKNRFSITEEQGVIHYYHLYFDKPKFALEIIKKIKSLYYKLGQNGVYY